MDFAVDFIMDRIHTIQGDIHEFAFVVSHVCYLHVLYDYVRLKLTNASLMKQEILSDLTLSLPKSDDKSRWDLRHIGCLLESPDHHVVFSMIIAKFYDCVVCRRASLQARRTKNDENVTRRQSIGASASMDKIARLEQEVEALRRKLAAILSVNESPKTDLRPVPKMTAMTTQSVPPPPPLPPLDTLANPMDFIKKQIQMNKSNSTKGPETPLMSLGEIMKTAKGIKLRHVERSPGGTPLRRPPLTSANDLHSILTEAMKRRFDLIYPDESPQHNSNSQWSPAPAEKKLGRKSSRPSLSPLQEIAC